MPTDLKALSALPCRVMPWPTPPSDSRRSTSTTSTPFWARASDSTPPVMPPPTTSTRLVWDSDMGGLLDSGDGDDGVGDELERVVDRLDLGRQVEEAVQYAGDEVPGDADASGLEQ